MIRGLLILILFSLSVASAACAVDPPALDAAQVESAQTDSTSQVGSQKEVTTGEAFLLKLKQGGGTMIFLLLCSVVTCACTLERFINQRKAKISPARLTAKAEQMWAAGDFKDLEAMASNSNSTLGRMLASIVRYRSSGFERVSTIAGDIASRDLKRHLQRAYPLAVVATIAPLLGLFGTVLGMIGAFDKIGVLGDLANPAAFGGDIGKALITTGAGLAIAIASLTLYHWFKSRIAVYGVELEEQISVMIIECFDSPSEKAPTLMTTPSEVAEAIDAD